MIQFSKIFAILISSFARPVITYTSRYELQRKTFTHRHLRRFFVYMGNKYNSLEILLARGRLRLPSAEIERMKVFADEVAYLFKQFDHMIYSFSKYSEFKKAWNSRANSSSMQFRLFYLYMDYIEIGSKPMTKRIY